MAARVDYWHAVAAADNPSHPFVQLLGHFAALIAFAMVAVAFSWPLAASLSTAIPGEPGDNLAFLWNTWWMRMALDSTSLDYFRTGHLFAPYGADLTLHTHTALPAWIAGTLLGSFPLVAAQNLTTLGSLTLNGFVAYLLAWDRVRVWRAAFLAGLVFAASPYVAAHLLGHYNLTCAWGLPLFLLFALRAVERKSKLAAAAAGAAVCLTAYCDYYYLVYEVALALGVGLWKLPGGLSWSARSPRGGATSTVLAMFLFVDLLLVAAILVTGGGTTTVLGVAVSATRPTNLLAVGWLLVALIAWLRWRPTVRVAWPTHQAVIERIGLFLPMLAVALLGLLPLLSQGWSLYWRGDYTAPDFSWRSGPGGVDLATIIAGNPSNRWLGPAIRSLYQRWELDRIEGVGWIGLVPLIATVWILLRLTKERLTGHEHRLEPELQDRPEEGRASSESGLWLTVAGVSFLWSLGPWLRVAGGNTGVMLPQNLLALLPIVGNARIPGRAMALVGLAAAMLVAMVLARAAAARRRWLFAGGLILAALDLCVAPFPLTSTDVPAIYERLRTMNPGAVCELPMGMRDGFAGAGRFDERVLLYQTVHGHPLTGGFLARIPQSLKSAYAGTPVLRSLLSLSSGGPVDAADRALSSADLAAALRRATVEYVVLDRATAPAALADYVDHVLPLRLLEKEGARELYVVKPPES